MISTTLSKQNTGLDLLADSLVSCRATVTPENFLSHIEASLEQLECDDNISPELTDKMVDSLLDAQELFLEGKEPWSALERMLAWYTEAKAEKSFFEQWTDKANALSREELRSELWDQFNRACAMVRDGQGHLLMKWLDKKIENFETRQEDYDRLMVSAREVTMESCLCHLFLSKGIQSWKAGLMELREACRGSVKDMASIQLAAERGQRFLVALQVYEREARLVETKYFVNYN